MKTSVLTLDGKAAGSVDLDETVFGCAPRSDILQRVVRWQLAKRRAGTHDTLNRGEVNRTKKKMYKQKGTGGARHAAMSAPIFRGGGSAHGPHPRSHEHSLNKKVRALGLKMALSAKLASGSLLVLQDEKLSEPKTRALKEHFGKLGLANALVIAGAEVDTNFALAARNIPNVDVLPVQGLNVYDVLRREKLVLTQAALAGIAARFAPKTESEAA